MKIKDFLASELAAFAGSASPLSYTDCKLKSEGVTYTFSDHASLRIGTSHLRNEKLQITDKAAKKQIDAVNALLSEPNIDVTKAKQIAEQYQSAGISVYAVIWFPNGNKPKAMLMGVAAEQLKVAETELAGKNFAFEQINTKKPNKTRIVPA